jgi:hypothetical protein
MKIADRKTIIKAGLPNMRQALFYAYHDPACQAADELHITPETGTKPKVSGGSTGSGPDRNSGAGQSGATAGGGADANSGAGENGGAAATSGTGGKE